MPQLFVLVFLCSAGTASAADWEASVAAGIAFGLDQPAAVVDHAATLHLVDSRVSVALRLHAGLLFSQFHARVSEPPRSWYHSARFRSASRLACG